MPWLAIWVTSASATSLTLAEAWERALGASPGPAAVGKRLAAARALARSAAAARGPDLGVRFLNQATRREFPAFFNVPGYSSELRASLTQDLWDGRFGHATTAASRSDSEAARAAHDRTRQELAERVTRAFLQVLEEGEAGRVFRESLQRRETRLAEIQAQVAAGVALQTAALAATLDREEDARELAVAESREAVARTTLRVLLGLAPGDPLELAPDTRPLEASMSLDPGETGTSTVGAGSGETPRDDTPESAPDFPQPASAPPRVRQARAAATAERQRARAGAARRGPTVSVGLDSVNIPSATGFGSPDIAFQEARGELAWTGWDGGARRAETSSLRHLSGAASEAARAEASEVHLASTSSRQALEEARARLAAARVRSTLATRNLAIAEERFRQGVAIRSQLLDADVALREAQLEEIRSRFQALRSVATGLALAGRLAPPLPLPAR